MGGGGVDREIVQRVSARHGFADIDRVVAGARVDGEGRVLAAVRILLALCAFQVDRVVALAGIQHHSLEAPEMHVSHAAARDRGGVEVPGHSALESHQRLELVADRVGLPDRVALVVEVQFVPASGPSPSMLNTPWMPLSMPSDSCPATVPM